MKAPPNSNGVDINSEMKSPELSKYWCRVNALWLCAKYSFKSSAMYTIKTGKKILW